MPGQSLLTYGFRPFFLFGAIYAGLTVLAWLPMFYGELQVASAFAPVDWHVHEMLYGYLPAIITGFLLTAIPNWTGRLPIQGTPLLVLVVVWLAGRVCVTLSAQIGWLAAGIVDAGFLILLIAAATREIVAGKNWRNLQGHRHGDVAARRQCRLPYRGACARSCRIRHPHRHRRHRAADHADRRPHHSELHAQLAGARESRAPAGAVRALRCRHACRERRERWRCGSCSQPDG